MGKDILLKALKLFTFSITTTIKGGNDCYFVGTIEVDKK